MTSESYSIGASVTVTWEGLPYTEITGTAGDDKLGFPTIDFPFTVTNYWIKGLGGDDRLFGHVFGDFLEGGKGNDTLIGNLGLDTLFGGPGKDLLFGGDGDDTLEGGKGNDTIKGGKDDDTIDGGEGVDTIFGGLGRDKISGGDGNDTLDGGARRDIIKGGKGDDTIVISDGRDKIFGGLGHDTLDASNLTGGVVVITAPSGMGHPSTGPGTIIQSNGTVQKVTGIESFIGSGFDDTFLGSAENSVLKGRAGDDHLETTGKGSKLVGGAGDDFLHGKGYNIELFGGKGADTIRSFGAGMKVLGGRGDDTITIKDSSYNYERAPSIIRGGLGNDTIKWLQNDLRLDTEPLLKVFGGAGADVFVFGFNRSGTMQDFQPGIDKIDLSGHFARLTDDPTGQQLMDMMSDTEYGAVLALDFGYNYGLKYQFVGVEVADFTADDFIL